MLILIMVFVQIRLVLPVTVMTAVVSAMRMRTMRMMPVVVMMTMTMATMTLAMEMAVTTTEGDDNDVDGTEVLGLMLHFVKPVTACIFVLETRLKTTMAQLLVMLMLVTLEEPRAQHAGSLHEPLKITRKNCPPSGSPDNNAD